MANFSNIRINKEVKEELDKLKEPSESYSSLVFRIIKEHQQLKEDVDYLKEEKKNLYKLALKTSNSVALVDYIHQATYFITKVLNDGTVTKEEQLEQLKLYLKEMLESYPYDVKAAIKNLKEMLELEEVNVPEVLIAFEVYVDEKY